MKSFQINWVSPKSKTSVLIRDKRRHGGEGHVKMEAKVGGMQSLPLQPPEVPQKLDEEKKDYPQGLGRKVGHLDFGLLAFRTVREYSSVV